MQNGKTFFVTGATGNQGGAVVKHLLRAQCRVKALTRNKKTARARFLFQENVEIITGDLDEPASYADHLKDIDGLFAVLDYKHGPKKEIRQGIDLVNTAKETGIRHFLYSSVIGADAGTGIPHWESKGQIENYLKQKGLHYTILRPASLYENMLIPQVRKRLFRGTLVTPLRKDRVDQYVSAYDVGRVASVIFNNPSVYIGKTINLAAEQIDGEAMAAVFSKVWGRPVSYKRLPGLITRLAMGSDVYKMFRWLNENKLLFVEDIPALKAEFPGFLSLEDWVRKFFR